MRKFFLLSLVAVAFVSCRQNGTSCVPVMRNALDSVSYCMGMDLGDYITRTNQKLDITDSLDFDLLLEGIKAAMRGDNTINSNSRYEILRKYFNETLPLLNERSAEDFLRRAQRAKKNSVRTSSGLVYEIVKPGNDERPAPNSIVYMQFEGRRMDGSLYETTYDLDNVENRPMDSMIPGMREGLMQIGVGGIIKLWIPPTLAYGKEGNDYIGPNQALYYYIELINIQ